MKKIIKLFKNSLKKIRYIDKTNTKFLSSFLFIALFCVFIGSTFSYFTFSKSIGSATLTIPKLNYELTSPDARFVDNSITVDPYEKIALDLSLKSLNKTTTNYALNYEVSNPDVKVYYRDEAIQNTSGTISTTNSVIDIGIVIENKSAESATVRFEVASGYTQNEISSNITEVYVDNYNVDQILSKMNITVKSGNPNFSVISPPPSGTDDSGVYMMEDDYGPSYYYRGAITNNYVQFAGFWWRIIRINGNGTLRIIYDGTKAHANGDADIDRLAINGVSWNETYNDDVKYVGYMYGGQNGKPSTSKEQAQKNETSTIIKTKIDDWYKTYIEDKGYSKYISDEIFCNDRSFQSSSYLGYAKNTTYFGAYERLGSGKDSAPIFTCPQDNDKFTVSKEIGNGALTYPIGLVTADEANAAGAGPYYYTASDLKYYLHNGSYYWTMTPYSFNSNGTVWHIAHMGFIYDPNITNSSSVSPVINIKKEYVEKMTGEGTTSKPYVIE